jgi:toxin YoeB
VRNLSWDIDAWDDYLYWQKHNKAILKRINRILKDMMRDPTSGVGKPERLKENLSGFYSRRINDEHRLVYKAYHDRIHIIQCRFHY